MNKRQLYADIWDKHAESYSKKAIKDPDSYSQKLNRTAKYLNDSMSILEVGCGTGLTSLFHAQKVKSVTAVDYSEKMIAIAHRNLSESGLNNVDFQAMDFFDLHERRAFDAILAMSILHLIDNQVSAILQARKLLKPGGLLVTSTICLGDNPSLKNLILPHLHRLGIAPAIKVLRSAKLIEELKFCGFRILENWTPAPGKATFIIAKLE